MAVAIRLRREGNKDRPFYRVVVTDSRARREGPYIEQVGTYDPMAAKDNSNLDLEKVESWLGKGAKPSETVASLIRRARKAAASAG